MHIFQKSRIEGLSYRGPYVIPLKFDEQFILNASASNCPSISSYALVTPLKGIFPNSNSRIDKEFLRHSQIVISGSRIKKVTESITKINLEAFV